MTAWLVATGIGVLVGTGTWLALRARTFDLVLGLTLVSYAVNLLIFVMGRLTVGRPPILDGSQAPVLANYADPLPQALVLTAIVIGFALMCFALVLVMQLLRRVGTDDALALRLVEPEPADPVNPPLGCDAAHAENSTGSWRAGA